MLLICLFFPLTWSLELVAQIFVKDDSVLPGKLFCKDGASGVSVESCAVAAIENKYDKFVFNEEAALPSKCGLCSECSEGRGSMYYYRDGDILWSIRDGCPGNWSAPVAWSSDVTPIFYLSFEETKCATMMCTVISDGKIGKGIYTPGAPAFAELVTTDMYHNDPERFCWIAPDTCPMGMTLSFWLQYKRSDWSRPGIINSQYFPPTTASGDIANAFGIYYIDDENKLFTYLIGNESVNHKNYYQLFLHKDLDPDFWYHVALSFSHADGLRMCLNGQQCESNNGKLEDHTYTKITGRLEFGRGRVHDVDMYMEGTIDDLVVFNQELSEGEIQLLAGQ